ncbi:2-oxoglutarate ferredoxin oxidoreductase subunit gamma, partial [candidate division KSB1 bacterium 4572_119]
RGGASRSEVIISDEEIDYPKAINIDFLLALTQESCERYSNDLKEDGILLIDSEAVKSKPELKSKIFSLPIIEIARNEVGRVMVANIVALGVIAELTKIVSIEALESAILSRVPKGTEEMNLKALKVGRNEGAKLLSA